MQGCKIDKVWQPENLMDGNFKIKVINGGIALLNMYEINLGRRFYILLILAEYF